MKKKRLSFFKHAPLLFLVLCLVLGGVWSYSKLSDYQNILSEKTTVEATIESLRSRAQETVIYKQQLVELEQKIRQMPWPPDLRTGGVGWLEALLAKENWKIKQTNISDVGTSQEYPIPVREIEVKLEASAPSYIGLLRGLARLLLSHVQPRLISVKVGDSGLDVATTLIVIRPEEGAK